MTHKNIKSNHYGSYQQKIIVRVDIEHVEAFTDAFDVRPFRTSPNHADFIVQTSSTMRGDDETIMYDIDYRLPTSPSFKGWKVLWNESTY